MHIWAGISWQGSTAICIFEGKMNAALFVQILDRTLLRFIRDRLPDHHKYMQENDPKHISDLAQSFLGIRNGNFFMMPTVCGDCFARLIIVPGNPHLWIKSVSQVEENHLDKNQPLSYQYPPIQVYLPPCHLKCCNGQESLR